LIKQGIILAGGKGQRLYPYTKKIPKPLVNIKGKPFLYYLIKQLEKFNFKQVTILAGYKSEKFDNFKKKFSKHFLLNFKIIKQPVNWETAKRINNIKNSLNKNFCLLYGDNLVNINSNYFNKKPNIVVIQSKKLAREKGNISVNKKNIKKYDQKRVKKLNYVELGYFILNKTTIFKYLNHKNFSFSKIIYTLVKLKKLKYYITKSKYLSITDPERLKNTKKNIRKYFLESDM
jgi:NDP-sugar pyrophosphorylase family protein